ncbi:hypothetical protein GQ457_14G022100 [Hibiscus cannabinus]
MMWRDVIGWNFSFKGKDNDMGAKWVMVDLVKEEMMWRDVIGWNFSFNGKGMDMENIRSEKVAADDMHSGFSVVEEGEIIEDQRSNLVAEPTRDGHTGNTGVKPEDPTPGKESETKSILMQEEWPWFGGESIKINKENMSETSPLPLYERSNSEAFMRSCQFGAAPIGEGLDAAKSLEEFRSTHSLLDGSRAPGPDGNELVFNARRLDENHLFDLVVSRIVWWGKLKWHDSFDSVIASSFQPWYLKLVEMKALRANPCRWVPPPVGMVMFNVDGAVEGGFERAGIGGILQNSKNETLALFSVFIGCIDATSAEFLAICEALSIFNGSGWSNSSILIVESDCSLCVKWVSNPHAASSAFKILIDDCLTRCYGLKWSIEYVERLTNGIAVKLAKSGISRSQPLIWKHPEADAIFSML